MMEIEGGLPNRLCHPISAPLNSDNESKDRYNVE